MSHRVGLFADRRKALLIKAVLGIVAPDSPVAEGLFFFVELAAVRASCDDEMLRKLKAVLFACSLSLI